MNKIDLKGTKNSRDFGGIKSKDGRVIKPFRFLRSDSLQNLTEDDLKKLDKTYNLSVVIDLRTEMEREEKPDIIGKNVKYFHIPLIDELIPGLTHEQAADKKAMLDLIPDMMELYKKLITEESSIEQLKKVFEVIISQDENSSVLWHCTEGKDRCGITSALFLSLLDVDREEIIKDYLDTNKAAYKKAAKLVLIVLLLVHSVKKAKRVWEAFTVDRKFIQSVFDELDEKYGSVDNFFEQKLGITKQMKEEFKNKVLR